MKIKVKLLSAKKIGDKQHKVYDVVEVDKTLGEKWIDCGQAVLVEAESSSAANTRTSEPG